MPTQACTKWSCFLKSCFVCSLFCLILYLGQVVEILPEDDGNPSIMVTSVDGPAMKDEGEVRHRGPIPRSPCPPFAVWTGDDNDAEGEQDDIPVYSDSDWEEEKDNNTRSHQGSLDPRASPELFNGHA